MTWRIYYLSIKHETLIPLPSLCVIENRSRMSNSPGARERTAYLAARCEHCNISKHCKAERARLHNELISGPLAHAHSASSTQSLTVGRPRQLTLQVKTKWMRGSAEGKGMNRTKTKTHKMQYLRRGGNVTTKWLIIGQCKAHGGNGSVCLKC